MKILFFGDIHINNHKSYNYFVYLSFEILDKVFDYAKKNDIHTIVFLGDLFQEKNTLPVEIAVELKNKLEFFKNTYKDIRIIGIVGNHDSIYENTVEKNCLQIFRENIEISDNSNVFQFFIGDKFTYWGLNYTKQYSEIKLPENFNKNIKNILITHNDIYEATLPNNTKLNTGIKRQFLNNFDLVFNGHIHNYAIFDNIIQVGSPYKYAINELNIPSGFVIFSEETEKHEFIELEVPKLVKIQLEENEEFESFVKKIKNIKLKNNFIELTANTSNLALINSVKKILIENNVLDVFLDLKVEKIETDNEKQIIENTNNFNEAIQKIKEKENLINYVKNYLENNKVEKIDKKLKFLNAILDNIK